MGGLCECMAGFYANGDACSPVIPPGGRCSDDDRCMDNALCQTDVTNPALKRCTCGPGFFNGEEECMLLKVEDGQSLL